MKSLTKSLALSTLCFIGFSCSSDDDQPIDNDVIAPATYSFERNGTSTVSFSGQTTRIQMAEELVSQMTSFDTATEQKLLEMYANTNNQFVGSGLNDSGKSIKSKTAASEDFFSGNAAESAIIKSEFESFLSTQISENKSGVGTVASPGVAGEIADGSSTRYINGKGLEYNQIFAKSLIGGLMTDQALNNYLGTAVLDEATNRIDNDNGITDDGKDYTVMEHKWDEAYGYLYGTAADLANPNATIGEDDSFLNKYIGRVEGDSDFAGVAKEIYDAFKLGRAAIVAKKYEVRDQQAQIIREKVSEIIAIRAVYYLQQAKVAINQETPNYGAAFHDLSEGYGFIYSLQFTRRPNGLTPYFSKSEVNLYLIQLMTEGGENGLWDVTPETLDEISNAIAAKFSFTVAQAGS